MSTLEGSFESDRRSDMFVDWVAGATATLIRWINSFIYIVGVPTILLSDIVFGGVILQKLFVHSNLGMFNTVAPWILSVATGAIQLGLWTLVFSKLTDKGFFSKAVLVIGFLGAVALSVIDTLIDALIAPLLLTGKVPVSLFPQEMGINVLGAVYLLFVLISFFGEPIVLFLLYANRKHMKSPA